MKTFDFIIYKHTQPPQCVCVCACVWEGGGSFLITHLFLSVRKPPQSDKHMFFLRFQMYHCEASILPLFA